jgi:hypothetical protein
MMPNKDDQKIEKMEAEAPKSKNNCLIIVIALAAVIILAVIVVIAIYYLFFSEWRGRTYTYENARFGYSIDYPLDWTLGEAPTNNDGRDFTSDDEEALCSVFGFANALTSESGGHQSLDEYIDWMLTDGEIELLKRETTKVDGENATYLLYNSMGSVMEAVYTLNSEQGVGFWCSYKDRGIQKKFHKIFSSMQKSIKLDIGESVSFGGKDCDSLLSGATAPLKDLKTFYDTSYNEVTIIERESWDRKKLPGDVAKSEDSGYTCYPSPMEFNQSQEGDNLSQPEVTKVEWQCELNYSDWKYLANESSEINDYKSNGYSCNQEQCDDNGGSSSVTLCAV